jgi:hypothetical protein
MPAGCPADLNADLFVDDSDFVLFATAYNELLCPAGEVILRDSIGPDNTLTNGQRVITNVVSSISGFDYVAFSLTPNETVILSEITVVAASPTGSSPAIVWGAFDYYVKVWSSSQARFNNPTIGNVLNCLFPFPSNCPNNDYVPPVFGSAIAQAPFNWGTTSHLLMFKIMDDPLVPCPPVVLAAGSEYVFALQPLRPQTVNTTMGVVTSLETGTVDTRFFNANPAGIPVTFYSTPSLPLTGRVGFRVVGVRQ